MTPPQCHCRVHSSSAGPQTYTYPNPKPEPEGWSPETATAPMPKNRVYYPLNWESGVLARTRCHCIPTPLFYYPYSRLFPSVALHPEQRTNGELSLKSTAPQI